MKALAKERERRYASAIGLANDVERFLNHEPVSAGPPTAAYRLRKFVRRNRGQVAAAALVLLALVLGVVGTTLGLFEAAAGAIAVTRPRRRRRRPRPSSAKPSAQQAEKRLAQVDEDERDPGLDLQGPEPQECARRTASRCRRSWASGWTGRRRRSRGRRPATRWPWPGCRSTLGESQLGLGYPEKAIGAVHQGPRHLRRRARPRPPRHAREHEQPRQRLSCRRPARPRTAAARGDAGAEEAKLGPDHPDTLTSMNNLAISSTGTPASSTAHCHALEETLALRKAKLGPDHPDTLATMNNLAIGYRDAGKLDRALPLLEETLAMTKAKLGPDHPDTLSSMNNLAMTYQDAGQFDRALPLLEETLALQKAKLGPDHPDTLTLHEQPRQCLPGRGQARPRTADATRRRWRRRRPKLGPDHPDTLTSMNNLAGAYQDAGQLDRALPLFEETLAAQRAKLGPDHPDTLATMSNLAVGLPGRRQARPRTAASSRRRWRRGGPSSAPTTPTRSAP